MTFEDLFFAVFLIGFAFQLSKYIAEIFYEFITTSISKRRDVWFWVLAAIFLMFFVSLSLASSSRQLF